MLFNSIPFLLFLPVVAAVYFVIPKNIRWIWLLVSSYYFYMCWNAVYLILIVISTVITYCAARLIASKKPRISNAKRFYAWFCLASNLGILFWFKYYNFFAVEIGRFLGIFGLSFKIPTFNILLPVGISFYTFQALGYMLDVYSGRLAPEKNLARYALFVSFFPQLVAGPIERSENLLPQLYKPVDFDSGRIADGLRIMLFGFFKKIAVADMAALFVNPVFDDVRNQSGGVLVAAVLLFTVQVYCDFSGYSDIAVGTAKIFGVDLVQNFKAPYFASSLKDFWTRWHTSLNNWFRNYLYIPLGGNRHGKFSSYLNVFIVFTVSGLWHGASLNFVFWGIYHGLLRGIETLFHLDKIVKGRISKMIGTISTFILVVIGWVFFRAVTIKDAFYIFSKAPKAFSADAILSVYNFICTNINVEDSFITHSHIYISFLVPCLVLVTAFDAYSAYALKSGYAALTPLRLPAVLRFLIYCFAAMLIMFAFSFAGNINNFTPAFIYFQF